MGAANSGSMDCLLAETRLTAESFRSCGRGVQEYSLVRVLFSHSPYEIGNPGNEEECKEQSS